MKYKKVPPPSKPKTDPFLNSRRWGFIGAGNITQSIISGILNSNLISSSKIFVASRTQNKVKALTSKFHIHGCSSPDEVLDQSDILFLAVKPQNLKPLMRDLGKNIDEHQLVVSFAAGYDLKSLRIHIPRALSIVRIMPSTGAQIREGALGYLFENQEAQNQYEPLIRQVLDALGTPILVPNEELLDAFMIGCSSGIGFVFEFMQIWTEWLEEKGFSPEESLTMTSKTFLAASLLANKQNLSLTQLQSQVASKKGVTAEGLESFRSMNLDRTLRVGFENALLQNRKLNRF